MINFVIYENELELKNCYEMIILNILGNKQENFKIIDIMINNKFFEVFKKKNNFGCVFLRWHPLYKRVLS